MAERNDVILVTVDSLRADRCGFMGYDGGTTPTLDRMAEDGLVFENAYAPAGATSGSASTFLTGSYPIEVPDAENRTEDIRHHLSARQTIPELFDEMGYETAVFTANPWMSRYFMDPDVADHFEDFMDSDMSRHVLESSRESNSAVLSTAVRLMNWWQGQDMFMSWSAFYDDLKAWLDQAESPYFAWIFLVDAHMPFLPRSEFRTQSRLLTYPANAWLYAQRSVPFESKLQDVLLEAYDNTIRDTDAFLERLDGDTDDPLLVVHADHGEEFGEHGNYGHGTLNDETLHVPLVVANGPNDTVTEPFQLRDMGSLLTTLAAGGDYRSVTSPVTYSRTFNSRALHGQSWKFVRSGDDEELVRYDPGEPALTDGELHSVASGLVDDWERADEERKQVQSAAAEVATLESL